MNKQALIAAGGFGTRMPETLNPKQSKPLIEYAGQSMLGHLMDGLKEGGIERFVIASAYHNHDEVREIVDDKNVDSVTIPISTTTFREIPYYASDLLDDQFLYVCGHHPLSRDYVSRMNNESIGGFPVITAFSNKFYPYSKDRRTITSEKNPSLRRVDVSNEEVPIDHWYLRNPYVVNPDVVELSSNDHFAHTFSYYLFEYWNNIGDLKIVETDIPPEFDSELEFERTKRFLDGLKPEAA